jgi:hypothetical protein
MLESCDDGESLRDANEVSMEGTAVPHCARIETLVIDESNMIYLASSHALLRYSNTPILHS